MPFPPSRPFAETKALLATRAREGRNPFRGTAPAAALAALERLGSIDREEWARAFAALALPHEERAAGAEARGDAATAGREWLAAYAYHRVARYPSPVSPAQRAAEIRARDCYLAAARAFDPPLERVEIPFTAGAREGDRVIAYLRRPRGAGQPPVVVQWGGIDAFKEERVAEPYLAAGFASLALDMPGTGESPVVGSEDAERLWDPVFDWLAARTDLDASRVAVVGSSTGGYWAAKLAHVRRERIRAAVWHSGVAHHGFDPQWIARAEQGEYPLAFAETLARAFGHTTYEGFVAYAPRLSLLNQGLLDRPCAPLLLIGGARDSVFPIADLYLLLEHGEPKSARVFPGGHVGGTGDALPITVSWLRDRLSR